MITSQGQYPGGHTTEQRGTVFAPDWVVAIRNIDFSGSDFNLPDGVCSVDLDGSPGSGGVSNSALVTDPGSVYTVTFMLSGNSYCAPTLKTMKVSAANDFEVLTWNTANGNNGENGDYTMESWQFKATKLHTKLEFRSLDQPKNEYNCGALIAAVSVTPNT